MKKAATQNSAVSLGTKRSCPKCALKFYDFSRPTIQCPKCGTEVDPDAQTQLFRQPPEAKKAKPKETIRNEEEEIVSSDTEEASFESLDDLDDDEEELDKISSDDDDAED